MTPKGWTPRRGSQNLVSRVGPDEAREQLTALLAGAVSGQELSVGAWRSVLIDIGDGHAERLMELDDRDHLVYWPRAWAARALGYVGDGRVNSALQAAIGDPHWRVRMNAVIALNRLGAQDWEEELQKATEDEHPRVREAADRAQRRLIESDP